MGVIYRSPESSLTDFNGNLENLLVKIDREKKYAFLSGDYNVNTLHELSCHASATQDFINLFSSFGYQKLISKPTRVVREGCTIKSSTLIDNIYTHINDWNDGISGVLHSDDVIIIKNIISNLKNTAAGHDDLPGSIMKECADLYITLTYIINLSISQGHFPSELKLAKVIPIYKSGDKQIIENYRPILVLPFFSNF